MEDKIIPVTKHEMNVAVSVIHTSEIPPTISAFSRPTDNKESITCKHPHDTYPHSAFAQELSVVVELYIGKGTQSRNTCLPTSLDNISITKST